MQWTPPKLLYLKYTLKQTHIIHSSHKSTTALSTKSQVGKILFACFPLGTTAGLKILTIPQVNRLICLNSVSASQQKCHKRGTSCRGVPFISFGMGYLETPPPHTLHTHSPQLPKACPALTTPGRHLSFPQLQALPHRNGALTPSEPLVVVSGRKSVSRAISCWCILDSISSCTKQKKSCCLNMLKSNADEII